MQLKISQNLPHPKQKPATYLPVNTVEGLDFLRAAVPLVVPV